MSAALQQLVDRIALQDLVIAYANAIDRRDFDALDEVFTADAYIDYRAMGGIEGPYPSVKAWLPEALGHFSAYMHLTGNAAFEIDGDQARGRVACFNPMVIALPDGGRHTLFLGLWYIDAYCRTEAGWRISRRSEEKSYDFNVPDFMKAAIGG